MGSDILPRLLRAATFGITFLLGVLATGCANPPATLFPSVVTNNDDGTTTGTQNDSAPQNEYCAPTADWPESYADFEDQVLTLVNEHRAAGADCGSGGVFDPVPALAMNELLRCAARLHSLDMFERGYFDHTNPDGDGPRERTTTAGYEGSTWGENIAWGYGSPEAVVSGWMNSPGHCANIMRASFTEIGIGYAEGNYWTQNFGSP